MGALKRNSLELMITRACSCRCSYCLVDKSRESMGLPTLRRAIRLLFTSEAAELHLIFFGGEPLSRPRLVLDALRLAESLSREHGRTVSYSLATSGLGLDERMIESFPRGLQVLLSLDGLQRTQERHWQGKSLGAAAYRKVLRSLLLLQRRNVPHFVNMVVEPADVDDLASNIDALRDLGVRRMQICFRQGVAWPRQAADRFLEGVGLLLREPRGLQLLNAQTTVDPILLHDDAVVDCDGNLYWWAGIFLEKDFPAVKRACRLGHLDDVRTLGEISGSPAGLGRILLQAYPASSRQGRILRDNIELGMRLRRLCRP